MAAIFQGGREELSQPNLEVLRMEASACSAVESWPLPHHRHLRSLFLGLGQLIALKLLSVTGGESSPLPGELTDVTAQHLMRFDSLNPYSTAEKTLVLRNMTYV